MTPFPFSQVVAMTSLSGNDFFFSLAAVPTPLLVAARKNWIEQYFSRHSLSMRNLGRHPLGEIFHNYQSSTRHFRVGGCVSAIWARSSGMDTVVISCNWVPSRTDILVPPHSPLKDVADLKGKRLTIPVRDHLPVDYPRASAFYAWSTLLNARGISLSEVEFVLVPTRRVQHAQQEGIPSFMPHHLPRQARPQKEEVALLLDGKADAMLTQLGRGVLYVSPGDMRSLYSCMPEHDRFVPTDVANAYPVLTVVHRDVVEQHPEIIHMWLKLEYLAAVWSQDNPQGFAEALAGMTDIPVSLQEQAFNLKQPQVLWPDMGERCIQAMTCIKDFLLQHGLIARDFSIKDWLAPQFLHQVLDEVQR